MGLGTNVPDAQRQARLRALKRLALRFLVTAQHQRLLRRVEIKPDHVPELFLKLLVVRQFEGAREMRLDVIGRPQPLHARRRDASGAGHRAAAPSPQMGRRRYRLLDDLLGRPLRQPRPAPAPRSIAQSCQPVPRKTPDPAVDLQARYAHPFGDLLLPQPLRAQQDDLGAPPLAYRHRAGANPAPQLPSLLQPQLDPLTSHDPSPNSPAEDTTIHHICYPILDTPH